MLLSMILIYHFMRFPTNEHRFLIQTILMGVWMDVNTVTKKKKIKQLILLWTIIVMHHFMRPPIKNYACLI